MSGGCAVVLHPERCSRCGKCLKACPKGILTMSSGCLCIDVAMCDGCFSCGSVCQSGAISASRTRASKMRRRSSKEMPALLSGKSGERPMQDTASPWTLLDAVTMSSVLLAAMLAKDAIVSADLFARLPAGLKITALSSVLLGFYAVQFVALAFLAKRHRKTIFSALNDLDEQGRPGHVAGSVALVLLLLVATRILSTAWGAVLTQMGFEAPRESGILSEVLGTGSFGIVLMLGTALVVGPLIEELVFRGVVASGFEQSFGLAPAVLMSAAMFAVYHVTPWLFLQMFVLGCALAWLALTRRTLWPAVALHALYNGISVLVWLAG